MFTKISRKGRSKLVEARVTAWSQIAAGSYCDLVPGPRTMEGLIDPTIHKLETRCWLLLAFSYAEVLEAGEIACASGADQSYARF